MPTATLPRVKELQTALQTKTTEIEGVLSEVTVEDNGGVVLSVERKDLLQKLSGEAKEIKNLLQMEQGHQELRDYLNAPATTPAAGQEAVAAARATQEWKTLGEMFTDSEEFKAGCRAEKPHISFTVDGSMKRYLALAADQAREQKDIYGGPGGTGGTATIPAIGTVQNVGITEARLRQKHIRDLFPRATTQAAVLYGARETGFVNNAAVVPVRTSGAFTTKPQSNLTIEPVMYPVARIAHWIPVHKDILADESRLQDFVNRRMTDGVMLAEDAAILFGAAGAENITGITNTPDVQTYTGLAADPYSAQIRRAVTLAHLAEYEPSGIVFSPVDWEHLELEQTTDGHYRIAVNIAIGGEKRVWSMDIVTTTAMTAGKFLLGSFGLGAQWYDREQVNVLASSEDATNFRQNLITIRAEERGALEVSRPESFVFGTFTVPT